VQNPHSSQGQILKEIAADVLVLMAEGMKDGSS
jgi:hypothetical protein